MKNLFTKFALPLTMAGLISAVMLPSMASANMTRPYLRTVQPPVATRSMERPKPSLADMKTQLNSMLDQLESHFQKVRGKVANLKNADQSDDLLQNIDAYLEQIRSLRTEVKNSTGADGLKKTAQKIHLLIENAKHQVKLNIGKRLEQHIDTFEKNGDHGKQFIMMAKEKIAILKAGGADINSLEQSLETCQDFIDQGNDSLENAKNKLQQVQELAPDQKDQAELLIKDGIGLIRAARTDFEEARVTCGNVMQDLKIRRSSN